MKHQPIPYVALGAAAMMLAGCGGGGSNSSAPTIPASYTVIDLSTTLTTQQSAGQGLQATRLNNAGQVTGNLLYPDTVPMSYNSEAFFYSNGSSQDISHPSAIAPNFFYANDFNNSGTIVGTANGTGSFQGHTIVLNQNTVTDITTTTGDSAFFGRAINDAGVIAGATYDPSKKTSVLAIVDNGKVQTLGTLTGYANLIASKVNQAGQIVGTAYKLSNSLTPRRAFLYSNGQVVDLGTLPNVSDSIATSINNSGLIVGASGNSITGTTIQFPNLNNFISCHAFLKKGATMVDLGTLSGDDSSIAQSINATGQIVGASGGAQQYIGPNGTPVTYYAFVHAFVYSQGKMVNLDTLLPAGSNIKLSQAIAINDQGQILAQGIKGTASSVFLLTPKS